MKSLVKICSVVSILVCVLLFNSCARKELYYQPKSKLRVNVHWPSNMLEKPKHNMLVFYPLKNDHIPLRYYMDYDSEIISIPEGDYRVMFYNWRTNLNSQTVQFRNENDYHGLKAFTGRLINKSGYFDDYDIFLSPDMLFCWSMGDEGHGSVFNLNKDGVHLDIYPAKVQHDYDFHVEVVGLQYVKGVSAVSLGFASELEMFSRRGLGKNVGHKLNIKITDNGFQCNFSAFNHIKGQDKILYFVIKLPDGTVRKFYRNVGRELDEIGAIINVDKIIIDYDGPIYPPTGGEDGGFEPPEIGDWIDIEEDILFPN